LELGVHFSLMVVLAATVALALTIPRTTSQAAVVALVAIAAREVLVRTLATVARLD
jgi:hypothetical protein